MRRGSINVDKALCELELRSFVSQMWPVLEPGREFTQGKPIEAVCEHLEAVADGDIKRLVINIPPGCTKPVSVGEWISTADGRKLLGDIEVGDMVLTHRGRYRRVEAVHEQGELPIIQITTASGRVVRTAPDHPFLTPEGWVKAEDLEVRDALFLVSRPDKPGPVLTPDEIVEIEHREPEPCRCLTVEEDSSFTVSDIAVHNSMLTNVFWPCWIWGPRQRPSTRFLSIAYNAGLTVRDNRRSRTLLESDEYKRLWPHVSLNPHEQNVQKFSNLQQGFRMASSTGGRVMGERADIVIIDDPNDTAKVESDMAIESALQFFTEVLPTRINDPKKSCMVVIMQRVHARDISGFILSQELGWEHLCLPMWYEKDRHCVTSIGFEDWRREEGQLLWPERFDAKSLERDMKIMKAWGGDFAVSGQMQQRPVGREGGMFKKKYFEIVDVVPDGGKIVRGWDLAATSKAQNPRAAYTTGVKGKILGGVLYVLDVVRTRKEPAQVEDFIYQCAQADGPQVTQDFPQDPGQAGKAQKVAIGKRLDGFDVRFSPETGDKVNRAIPLSSKGELGLIKVKRGMWNEDFLSEITMFPRGDYKDQVDALSRCYARLLVQPVASVPAKPILVTVDGDPAEAA